MDISEVVEIWIRSLREVFETGGVEIAYTRSPSERPNSSFALTLRRDNVEADLIVWKSGHADLSTMDSVGSVTQKHFENLNDVETISDVLAVLASVLPVLKKI